MESEVDTSILNSVNIKRFTQSVLEEYEADIDRSNSAKWQVTFPDELAERLDREHGTLVFDAADRELGAGDLLVQPGTTVFSALLDLVQQPGSIGRLRLTEDSLQVNPPSVLRESDLEVEVTNFSKRTSDFALAFHFRVQFETPSSFHNEEMFTVTVDPDTQTRLPELTARLTSHLPQLLQQNNEHSSRDISQANIQQAFEEAQQAVIDRSRPIVSDIRDDADESASERIGEISDWYEQRREELDQQLKEQRSEIRKWKKKRRKARKDSTRREYIRNRKEAEEELERLQKEVQRKKQELDEEESEEIDEVIERNEVNVDVTLLGVTEVTYVHGTLALELDSGHATADVNISYLPATDEFRGLDCYVCSHDLTDGTLPQLCVNGHVAGDPCVTSCRNCGLAYCSDCETTSKFSSCTVCWEDVCHSCVTTCELCDSAICEDHKGVCTTCNEITCRLCGEECSTCGDFHCDTHLEHCADCDEYYCRDHVSTCDFCGEFRCGQHIDGCAECGTLVCSDHGDACTTCGDVVCDQHIEVCGICVQTDGRQRGFCHEHSVYCSVGDEPLCSDHRISTTIGSGQVCAEHRRACSTCKVDYRETALTDGQCSACQSLGEVSPEKVPGEISDEFRSVKAGGNNAYLVILGKKLLGRNQLVVYDLQTGEESHRHSAGMLKQLLGEYE
jgi:hypothetical protein